MSEIKWIKIVTDIFDDEKVLLIETLPEGDSVLVIWLKLLCLAGKQNNSGVFVMQNGMPYTDKMLSVIFRRKEATVKMALETFQSFGMIQIVENAITIPNWGKHQNFDKIELKNEYMRNYMKEYRARQKLIAGNNKEQLQLPDSKSNSKANGKANVSLADKSRVDKIRKDKKDNISPNKSAYSSEFESFWLIYPSKVGKGAAFKSFKAALKKTSIEEIMNGLSNYKDSKKVADGYVCNPQTWLNQERWSDECELQQYDDPYNLSDEQIADIYEMEERIAREESLKNKQDKG